MRRLPRALLSTGLVAAIALAPGLAESFPGSPTWVELTRGGGANLVLDAAGDGSGDRDVVGSGTDAATFVASDANHLFLRLRVDLTPLDGDGTFFSSVWGCMSDTNGTLTNYEFLAALDGTVAAGPDGARDEVVWRHNAVQNALNADVLNETAEVVVQRFARATYAQTSVAPTTTSGNADHFVDLEIPFATIRGGGNGAPAIPKGAPVRFACGASGSSTQVGGDVATSGGASLSAAWSDLYVCDDAGYYLDAIAGVADAGAAAAPPPDSASLRGSGLACSATTSSAPASSGLVLVLAAIAAFARRLRAPGRSSARTRR